MPRLKITKHHTEKPKKCSKCGHNHFDEHGICFVCARCGHVLMKSALIKESE